jgi:predicted RNA binding protein with dsRBD fold (UPF0201 family)
MDYEAGCFNEQTIYQIKLRGLLRENWADWLDGTRVCFSKETNRTSITVAVPDQAALRGILNRLWDLNLTIISVTQEKGWNDA